MKLRTGQSISGRGDDRHDQRGAQTNTGPGVARSQRLNAFTCALYSTMVMATAGRARTLAARTAHAYAALPTNCARAHACA